MVRSIFLPLPRFPGAFFPLTRYPLIFFLSHALASLSRMRIDDFPGVKFATYLHDFSLHFPVLCSCTALEVVKLVMCAPQNVPSSLRAAPSRKAARAFSTRVIRSSRRNPSRLELYLTRTSLHFVIKYLSTIATIVS